MVGIYLFEMICQSRRFIVSTELYKRLQYRLVDTSLKRNRIKVHQVVKQCENELSAPVLPLPVLKSEPEMMQNTGQASLINILNFQNYPIRIRYTRTKYLIFSQYIFRTKLIIVLGQRYVLINSLYYIRLCIRLYIAFVYVTHWFIYCNR